MGYVGDDVMKNWIMINYHEPPGRYGDDLAQAWQAHQDNCTNPPVDDRWYNDQTEPYLQWFGGIPAWKTNGESPNDEWAALNQDFLNTGVAVDDFDQSCPAC